MSFISIGGAHNGRPRWDHPVVVINGYGCNIDSPLRPYLDEGVEFILANDVHQVVFSGGFTQRKSFPGKSEAAAMRDYVLSRLPTDWAMVVHTEEDSYTTHENAVNTARILRFLQRKLWDGLPPRPGELTVFCETQRALKVLACYWVLLPEYRPKDGDPSPDLRVQLRTVSWERANPLMEIPKAVNEVLALYVPFWGRWMRNNRIAKSETR